MPQDEPVGGLDEIADALYAGSPADFVARRDDAARAARERGERPLATAIARLRRPTRAAWLSNLLVRHRGEQLDALLSMAGTLADAQRTLDGDALRALSSRRRKLVTAMAREAGRLAAREGEQVSESLLRELGDILDAALADPDVAREVRSGRLARSVSYSGFGPEGGGEIDLDAWAASAPAASGGAAVADRSGADGGGATGVVEAEQTPDDHVQAGPEVGEQEAERGAAERAEADRREAERIAAERAAAEAARERERRERALAEAEEAQEAAENKRDEAESAHDAAVAAREALRERIDALTAELEAAREQERADAARIREAVVALRAAARSATGAAARTARARARLDELS